MIMPLGSKGSSQETRISEKLRTLRTGRGTLMGTVKKNVKKKEINFPSS